MEVWGSKMEPIGRVGGKQIRITLIRSRIRIKMEKGIRIRVKKICNPPRNTVQAFYVFDVVYS
jgi:hypothetical protein